MAASKPRTFKVLTGLNYGDTRREPGDIVNDIPAKSVTWLLRDGAIELVEDKKPTTRRES